MDQPHVDPAIDDQVDIAPEAEPQAPTLVRIRYNGDTYEVPEHVADVWMKREEDHKRQLSELDRFRKAQQPEPRREQPSQAPQDRDMEFWTDPAGYIDRAFEAQEERRRQEENVQRAASAYWAEFYQSYPHLRGKDVVVRAVLDRVVQQICHLPPEESMTRLAEATDQVLGAPVEDGKPLVRRQVTSEPASPGRASPRPAQPTEDPSPSDGKSIIRALRERKRAALYRRPKE